ncbi:MAG TPA: PIN domain-containing protein [Chthoniobacteraceae bacterium]|jgi:predicted nucleic acid-binding protein|nr:PIN domain-containing protein [Chthoniobacteraceae bacterium]
MKDALDSSILVAALDGEDPDHEACRSLFLSAKYSIHPHALTETFSTLTGGRLALRLPAQQAAALLRQWVAPRLVVTPLDTEDLLTAFDESSARGVRGGAIYDYLHLVAARIARAPVFYTLNISDFRSFHRPGDPEVVHP